MEFKRLTLGFPIIIVSILIGSGITLYGLLEQKWPDVMPIRSWSIAEGFFYFIAGGSFIIGLGVRLTKFRISAITVGLGVLIALMANGIWPLIATIFYALASLALGHIILNLLRIPYSSIDTISKLLVGAGIYATLVSLSAHVPINYSWLYFLGLFTSIFYARSYLFLFVKESTSQQFQHSDHFKFSDWPSFVLGGMFLLHFSFAFLPEMTADALAIHLLVPGHMEARHEWGFNPEFYSLGLVPMLGEWNFTIGYLMAGESATRLINVGFIFLTTGLIRSFVLWAGGSEKGAVWATLLFLATPLTFQESSSLHIESVWGAYILAGTYWVFRTLFEPGQRIPGVVLGGIMLGFAAASKAVTLAMLPVLFLPFLFCLKACFSEPLRGHVAKGLTLFTVLGTLPYVNAYLISGNPLFPFYNGFFKSTFYPLVDFSSPFFHVPLSFELPYQLVFFSNGFIEGTVGSSGFQWVLLLLPVLCLIMLSKNKRFIALLIIGGVSLLIVFSFTTYLRYIFPVFAFWSILIGGAISISGQFNKFLLYGMTITASATLGLNLLFFGASVWHYRNIPVMEVFNPAGRDQLILTRAPIRKAVELVNTLNINHAPVAFLSRPHAGGLKADALYPNWYNHGFQRAMNLSNTPANFAKTMQNYGATYIVYSRSWGTPELREIVVSASDLIANFGSVSVRVLNKNSLYSNELLTSPGFENLENWNVSPDTPITEEGTLIVSTEFKATQAVPVQGGTSYLNSVTARCSGSAAMGRVQVNWLDGQGDFITANIITFDCTKEWKLQRQEFISPGNATLAIVYATSHSKKPIEVLRVSFKE